MSADPGAGTEAKRGFSILDRENGFAGPQPEGPGDMPASGEARVERQRTIDQRHHRAEILGEIGRRVGGIRQDAGIVAGQFEGSPGEIDALATVYLRIFALKHPITAECRPG
jgi:hypothetical protein